MGRYDSKISFQEEIFPEWADGTVSCFLSIRACWQAWNDKVTGEGDL
jgi:hypothetical protein